MTDFNSALTCLKQESLLDWTSSIASFMHGTDNNIFTCIFRDCNYSRSNGFEHPWDLSRHLLLHHKMIVEPLGEGRHPDIWNQWERSYLVNRPEEYSRLSWKDKYDFYNKMIARSVDWARFQRQHIGKPQLSPRQIALSEGSLLNSLRSTLWLKVRSEEIAAYVELKVLVIKLCIWLSFRSVFAMSTFGGILTDCSNTDSNVHSARVLKPAMDEILSKLQQLISLIIQLDDRLSNLISTVIKTRREFSDSSEEQFGDDSHEMADWISYDIARTIKLTRTLLQNFEESHNALIDSAMVSSASTSQSPCISPKSIPWRPATKSLQNPHEDNEFASEFLKFSAQALLLIKDALNTSETLRACLEIQYLSLPILSASILKSNWPRQAYGRLAKPKAKRWSEFRTTHHDIFGAKELRAANFTPLRSVSLPSLLREKLPSFIRPAAPLQKFEYAPLNEASGEIRLLTVKHDENLNRLSGKLSYCSLNEYPRYIALSYTWGGQKATETIVLDGIPLSITPNLASALRSKAVLDASSTSTPVWADAICINQRDVKERSRQVLRMRRIYGQASTAVIWLGTESNNSRDAFSLIRYLISRECKEETLSEYIGNPNFENQWLALCHLLQRDWWSRVWIIQEAVVSHLMLTCGDSIVDISNLDLLVRELDKIITLRQHNNINHNPDNRGIQRLKSLAFLRRWWQNSCADTVPLDLLTVLATSRSSFSSDRRDKLYGVLGLAGDSVEHVPVPDYGISLQEVYGGLVKSFVSQNVNLDIICYAGSSKADPTLPSWVPDWSDDACGPSLCRSAWLAEDMPNDRDVRVSMIIAPVFSKDLKRMTVWGYFIDNVAGVSGMGRFAGRISNSVYQSSHRRAYKGDEGIFQAIISSLSAAGKKKNYSTAHVFRRKLSEICQRGYTDTFGKDRLAQDPIHQWYQSNRHFRIEGRSLEYWFNLRPTPLQVDCKSSGDPDIDTFRSAFSKTMLRRRLFTTAAGYVGVAREPIEPRDLLCILPGCSVPVILRKKQHCFAFIGDTYVHGLTSGEFRMSEEKKITSLRTFTLV
ncbi:heterokaryon incompatibility protein-domain-containing protein [Xylaria grammica]|nr:heterokaryon incompatibility protein-domain-containing protein [Xylaria grammica]